jgi:hypothetical protein
MATKKKTTFKDPSPRLDDLNLDLDDFNFGDPNAKAEKRRKPILKVATNVGRGSLSHFTSETFIRSTLANVLPSGYDSAVGAGYEIRDNVGQLYNTAASEWRKMEPTARRVIEKMMPTAGSILPKAIADRLNKFAKGGPKAAGERNEDEDTLRSVLSELEMTSETIRAQDKAERNTRDEIERQIDNRRHSNSLRVMASMDARLSQMQSFNDQVFSRYQRRSLEIQYRQYFATRDLLKLQGSEMAQQRAMLQAIVHNTGLPDGVKSKMREKYGEGLREKLSNASQTAIVGHLGGYFQRARDKLHDSVRNVAGGVGGALSGVQMSQSQVDMMRSMGMDVSAHSQQALGGMLAGVLGGFVGKAAQGAFARSGFTAQKGSKLGRLLRNVPDTISEWAGTTTKRDGVGGAVEQAIKDHFGTFKQNRRIGGAMLLDNGDPGTFTKRTQRTIEEIMPGYLSRILHELTMTRTGNPKAERVVWNDDKSEFTTHAQQGKDVAKRLFNNSNAQFGREQAKDFADQLLAGKSVSATAHHELTTQILANTLAGKKFNPAHYLRPSASHTMMSAATRKEISGAVRGRFKGANGRTDQTVVEALDRQHRTLRSTIPDPKNMVSAYRDSGAGDHLRAMGLTEEVGDDTMVNYDALAKRMAGERATTARTSPYSRATSATIGGNEGGMFSSLTDKRTNLYKVGSVDPIIFGSKVLGGQYRNAKTGAPIRLMHEVLNGVIEDDKIIVTAAQAAKLQTSGGESFPQFLERSKASNSKAQRIIDGVSTKINAHATAGASKFDHFMEHGKGKVLYNKLRGRKSKRWTAADVHTAAEAITTPAAAAMASTTAAGSPIPHAAATAVAAKLNKAAAGVEKEAGSASSKIKNGWRRAVASGRYGAELFMHGKASAQSTANVLMSGMHAPTHDEHAIDHPAVSSSHVEPHAAPVDAHTQKVKEAAAVAAASIHAAAAAAHAAKHAVEPKDKDSIDEVLKGFKEAQHLQMAELIDLVTNRDFTQVGGTVMGTGKSKSSLMDKMRKTRLGLFGKWGSSAIGGTIRGAATATRGYGSYVGSVFRGMGSAVGFGGRSVGGITKFLTGPRKKLGREAADVYVKGDKGKTPRLTRGRMLAGDYFDEKGMVITCPADIKGPVYDGASGERGTILSVEDLRKGIIDGSGRSLLGGLVASGLGALGSTIRGVGGFYGAMFKGAGSLVTMTLQAVKHNLLMRHHAKDVYTPDNLVTPKLYATVMKHGGYLSVKTGKPVRGIDSIDGAVREAAGDGNIVLTQEEFQKGLVDVKGKPLKLHQGLLGKAVGGAMSLVGGYAKLVGHMARGGMALAAAPFKMLTALFGWGHAKGHKGGLLATTSDEKTHNLLTEVLHMLDARMPENEHYRVGSWEEKMAMRKKGAGAVPPGKLGLLARARGLFGKKNADGKDEHGMNLPDVNINKEEKVAKEAGRVGKFMGKVKGKIGGLMGKSKVGRGIMRAGEKVMGGAGGKIIRGGGKIVGGAAKTLWNVGKLALGVGSFGEVAGGVATIAGGIGSAAAGIGGAVAAGAGAVASGIGAAATAIGGILSLPVLLGAAAVAAVGVAVYYGYKYYSLKKKAPLRKLRMAQYGIDMNKGVMSVDKVQKLEAMLLQHVTVVGGKAIIDPTKVDNDAILKLFDLKKSWYNPTGWFHKADAGDVANQNAFFQWLGQRFRPVFLNWVGAVHQIAPKMDMADADSEMSAEQKRSLLKSVMAIDGGVYAVTATPFSDTAMCGKPVVDAAYAEALKDLGPEKKGGSGSGGGGPTKVGLAAIGGKGGPTSATGVVGGANAAGIHKAAGAAGAAALTAAMKNPAGKGDSNKVGVSGKGQVSNNLGFLGGKMTALMAVRFKTYGLIDMDPARVKALFLLETDVFDKIIYDGKGTATFKDDASYYFDTYAGYFGISPTDDKAKLRWYSWFAKRFVPTILQFATAVKHANKTTDPRDADQYLSPEHILDVANMTAASAFASTLQSASVWSFLDSPFDDKPLNADATSVKPNIQALEDTVEKKVLAQEQAKKQTTAPNANTTSIQNAANPSANPSSTKDTNGTQVNKAANDNQYNGLTKVNAKTVYQLPAGMDAGSNAANIMTATGGKPGAPVGSPVAQPGNGTAGDINKLPMPAGGAGYAGIKAMLDAAGKMTGVDPTLLGTFAGIESSWNPSAHAPTSSAGGLFQFINSTWRAMLTKYGSKYGIAPNTPNTDPRASALMGAEFLKENQAYLTKALGRAPTDTELYVAHFLGPAGAKSLLSAPDDAIGAQVAPAAATANQGIFYANGMASTKAGIMKLLNTKVGKFRSKVTGTPMVAATDKDYSAPTTGGNTTTTANGAKGGAGAPSSSMAAAKAASAPAAPGASGAQSLAAIAPPGGKPTSAPGVSPTVAANDDPVVAQQSSAQAKATAADAQAQATSAETQGQTADMVAHAAKQTDLQTQMAASLAVIAQHAATTAAATSNTANAATAPGAATNPNPATPPGSNVPINRTTPLPTAAVSMQRASFDNASANG